MEKEILFNGNVLVAKRDVHLFKGIVSLIKLPILKLMQYYSYILGKDITIKQTLLLLNVQFAFLFAVFPVNLSIVLRVVFAVWFITALLQCGRSGIKTSDELD